MHVKLPSLLLAFAVPTDILGMLVLLRHPELLHWRHNMAVSNPFGRSCIMMTCRNLHLPPISPLQIQIQPKKTPSLRPPYLN